MQYPHTENYKGLLRKIMERCVKMPVIFKLNCSYIMISVKIPTHIFVEFDKLILKFMKELDYPKLSGKKTKLEDLSCLQGFL